MRRRRIILLTILVAILVSIHFMRSDTNPDDDADTLVSIAFKDLNAGPPFGARGFDLTNSGPKSILLTRVWVRTWQNDGWTNSMVKFTTVLPLGHTNIEAYNPIIEPGECRRVVAEWPTNVTWRVQLQYATEMSLVSKADLALKVRDFSNLTNRSWHGLHYVLSSVIRN